MRLLLRGARTTSAARCLCQRCAVGPGHATGSTPAAAASHSLMAEGARPHSSAADGDAVPQMSEQEQLIADKLRSALESPEEVTVTDISGGCGSMFRIKAVAGDFKGKSLVKQHQLVNKILAIDIATWHGLTLELKAPPS